MNALHVETTGAGPPLVMLHGWAMHGGMFDSLVPALARCYRVSVVDLPGHGRSAMTQTFAMDAVVETLAQVFAGADAPLAILGWSLGGTVALRWASLHPEQVGRLLLVCTTPRFVATADWHHAMDEGTLRRFGDELRVAHHLTLLRFLSLQMQGGDEGRATLAALRSQLFARGEPAPEALISALAALAAADLRDDVRAILAPTLVVTGEHDSLVPAAAGAWLARAMPVARHVDIAGAAHAPFLSHRAAFDAAVEPFFDAL